MSRVVVIDTNMMHSDALLSRPGSEALLAGAEAGRFLLVVPEVVLAEATKHYGGRLRKALKELNFAIGRQRGELVQLGQPIPTLHDVPSRQSAEADYSERLRERLREFDAPRGRSYTQSRQDRLGLRTVC